MALGFGSIPVRWIFWVQDKPGRAGRKPKGHVVELQGQVDRELPPSTKVQKMIDAARGMALQTPYSFAGLTEYDLRTLAAASLRGEVTFGGSRFTRFPALWRVRR